jgi:hypothetical protein
MLKRRRVAMPSSAGALSRRGSSFVRVDALRVGLRRHGFRQERDFAFRPRTFGLTFIYRGK